MSEAGKRQWYVVYTKPYKEELVQSHFRLKGLDVFFPRLLLPSWPKERNRIVPLFPCYLFVRIHLSVDYHSVLWSPGVKHLVSFGGTPAPIEEDALKFLMQGADPNGVITPRSNLRPGQKVQIEGGLFDGLEGIIQDPPDAKGRIRVLMTLLNRQLKVVVPVHFVKSGWVVARRDREYRAGSAAS